jgi:hypothetical protein
MGRAPEYGEARGGRGSGRIAGVDSKGDHKLNIIRIHVYGVGECPRVRIAQSRPSTGGAASISGPGRTGNRLLGRIPTGYHRQPAWPGAQVKIKKGFRITHIVRTGARPPPE